MNSKWTSITTSIKQLRTTSSSMTSPVQWCWSVVEHCQWTAVQLPCRHQHSTPHSRHYSAAAVPI